jgi:enoyl-CoA hydratase/carnithine racemase
VITGAGDKAFSTGRDLRASKEHTQSQADEYMQAAISSVLAVRALPLPTIAAINGHAYGWGLELALACDFRFADEKAILCFPETSLGLFPGACGTVLASRVLGPTVAKELIYTARRFTGLEAASPRIGLAVPLRPVLSSA